MIGVDEAAEGRESLANIGDLEVRTLLDPSGEEVLVADEVTDIAFDEIDGLCVFLRKCRDVGVAKVIALGKEDQLIREILVENEAEV